MLVNVGTFWFSLHQNCIKAAMATITKRGKSWFVQVRKKGISLSRSFTTKGQATTWATKTEAEILEGKHRSGTDKTLLEAIDRYLEEVTPTKKSSKDEICTFNRIRKQPFAELKVSEITTAMIAQYRDDELKRVSSPSALRYINTLSSLFEQMRTEWQWVSSNPVLDVKKPSNSKSRDRIFTDDEIKRILIAINHNGPATEIQQTIGDVFLFALETAMRAGEIVNLEWDRVYIDRKFVRLVDTKNRDNRNVSLSTNAINILNSRLGYSKPFDLKLNTLRVRFPQFLKKAGVENACFHDSRHTAVTRLARKLNTFELARMAGHRNLSQTLAYFNETAEQIANKLD